MTIKEFSIGDVVQMRKVHPCGSYEWAVVRLGADIGLKCQGCGRRVLLSRRALERRVKGLVSHGAPMKIGADNGGSCGTLGG